MSSTKESLPAVLRSLLMGVRDGLHKKGDDGSASAPKARVTVMLGWPEVRAIYALHTAVKAAREATLAWKVRAAKLEKERARAEKNGVIFTDRAFLNTLKSVQRVLNGEETSSRALFDARKELALILKRLS